MRYSLRVASKATRHRIATKDRARPERGGLRCRQETRATRAWCACARARAGVHIFVGEGGGGWVGSGGRRSACTRVRACVLCVGLFLMAVAGSKKPSNLSTLMRRALSATELSDSKSCKAD